LDNQRGREAAEIMMVGAPTPGGRLPLPVQESVQGCGERLYTESGFIEAIP